MMELKLLGLVPSFPSVSFELILLQVRLELPRQHFHIFWRLGLCQHAPCIFGTRVDKLIRDCLEKFDNFPPFSVAQSAGGLAKGFDF
jgi:hypothetical protein